MSPQKGMCPIISSPSSNMVVILFDYLFIWLTYLIVTERHFCLLSFTQRPKNSSIAKHQTETVCNKYSLAWLSIAVHYAEDGITRRCPPVRSVSWYRVVSPLKSKWPVPPVYVCEFESYIGNGAAMLVHRRPHLRHGIPSRDVNINSPKAGAQWWV